MPGPTSYTPPLLTTFGLGFLRPASGTWGSMPPVLLAGVLIAAGMGPHAAPLVYHAVLALVLVVFTLACVMGGDEAEARFHRKDPGQVVADETAGQCIPLLALPAAALASPALTAFTLLLAFLFFRFFDIFKPWPAGALQKQPGGWGIVLDDLVAGVQALVLLQLVALVLA